MERCGMVDWIEIWVLFAQYDGGQSTFAFSERFAFEKMFANWLPDNASHPINPPLAIFRAR